MSVLQALKAILPLGFTAGINLYLTFLVVGLTIRLGLVSDYPSGLDALASTPILIVAGILYILEFIIDKIPFLDSLWDLVHTIIRPVGAILISSSVLSGLVDQEILETTATFVGINPRIQLIGAILMAVIALITHSGKAGTRVALNTTGSQITCIGVVLSLAEDILVALIAFLALKFPTLANIIAWSLLLFLIVVVPQLMRWAWFTLKAMWGRIRGFIRPRRESEIVPAKQQALLPETYELSVHCQAQGSIKSRYGFLVVSDQQLSFIYRRWFRTQCWQIERAWIEQVKLQRGLILLSLHITYSHEQPTPSTMYFVCTYDRKHLVQQIVQLLDVQDQAPLATVAPA